MSSLLQRLLRASISQASPAPARQESSTWRAFGPAALLTTLLVGSCTGASLAYYLMQRRAALRRKVSPPAVDLAAAVPAVKPHTALSDIPPDEVALLYRILEKEVRSIQLQRAYGAKIRQDFVEKPADQGENFSSTTIEDLGYFRVLNFHLPNTDGSVSSPQNVPHTYACYLERLYGKDIIDLKDSDWNNSRIVRAKNSSKACEKVENANTILQTYEQPEEGAIIVAQSFGKTYDGAWNPDGTKTAPWSALVMDNWRKACKGDSTKIWGLWMIARDHIIAESGSKWKQNKTKLDDEELELSTQDAIDAAFKALGHDTDSDLLLMADSKDPIEAGVWDLLSAQVHVSRVYFMLRDYRSELGNKVIKSLRLFHPDNDWTDDIKMKGTGKYHIVIELKEGATGDGKEPTAKSEK